MAVVCKRTTTYLACLPVQACGFRHSWRVVFCERPRTDVFRLGQRKGTPSKSAVSWLVGGWAAGPGSGCVVFALPGPPREQTAILRVLVFIRRVSSADRWLRNMLFLFWGGGWRALLIHSLRLGFDSFGPGNDMQLLGDTGGFSAAFLQSSAGLDTERLDRLRAARPEARVPACHCHDKQLFCREGSEGCRLD